MFEENVASGSGCLPTLFRHAQPQQVLPPRSGQQERSLMRAVVIEGDMSAGICPVVDEMTSVAHQIRPNTVTSFVERDVVKADLNGPATIGLALDDQVRS